MLTIEIKSDEKFDELNAKFVYTKGQTIQLEHSLISLSKWESKWHKPFIGNENMSTEEIIDYIRCMTITPNVDESVYKFVDNKIIQKVNDYISDPMTATWINRKKQKKGGRPEIITAEVIYYWMIALNIPFECQKWHLNRLIMLIEVCNEKNNPKKKSRRETLSEYANINQQRRAAAAAAKGKH